MAVTTLARVAFAGDCGGAAASKTPKVAAAINAAFRRFVHPASTWLVIGGDEYPWCSATTMKHYDVFLSKKYIVPSRTVMTPGNHTNGPGGSANEPNAKAWLAYNRANGTHTRTGGGWIDKSMGIPMTDQYIDIAGIRFIVINSGAVKDGNPGWPTPGHSAFSDEHPRVVWLRSVWAPGTRNVVITHHPRWSYYGSPFDNTGMQNLIDEIVGKNDGSKPHSSLIIQGHSHNMQLMRPQLARGNYPGLVSAVAALCSTPPAASAAGAQNTSKKSWLHFANISPGGCGFLQIDIRSDGSLRLSMIDAVNSFGNLMKNTRGTGVTGLATATVKTRA